MPHTDVEAALVAPLPMEKRGSTMVNVSDNDRTAYVQQMKEITAKAKALQSRLTAARIVASTTTGNSLLDVHIQTLAQYIHSLIIILYKRVSGESLSSTSEADNGYDAIVDEHDDVDDIIEARIILERIKPLEQKLMYQIDKALRLAASSLAIDEKTKLDANGDKKSDESSQSGSDDDDDELLAFRPNPAMLEGGEAVVDSNTSLNETESNQQKTKLKSKTKSIKPIESKKNNNNKEDEDDVYRPPRVAPQVFREESMRKSRLTERAKKSALGSRVLREVTDELGFRPEEIAATGATYAGKLTQQASADDRRQAEREAYEEDNFVRLPTSREDNKRAKRIKTRGVSSRFDDEFANIGKEFDVLGDVSKLVKERQKPLTILEKRNMDNAGLGSRGTKRNLDSTIGVAAKRGALSGATSAALFDRDIKRAKRAKELRHRVRTKQERSKKSNE